MWDKYEVGIVDDGGVGGDNWSFECWKDDRLSLEGAARNGMKG